MIAVGFQYYKSVSTVGRRDKVDDFIAVIQIFVAHNFHGFVPGRQRPRLIYIFHLKNFINNIVFPDFAADYNYPRGDNLLYHN